MIPEKDASSRPRISGLVQERPHTLDKVEQFSLVLYKIFPQSLRCPLLFNSSKFNCDHVRSWERWATTNIATTRIAAQLSKSQVLEGQGMRKLKLPN